MTDEIMFPDIITGTPTLQQIVSTTKEPDDQHKVRFYFMISHGDPIGEFYCTQGLEKGMLVRVLGNVHPVESFMIDPEDGLCCLLEAVVKEL